MSRHKPGLAYDATIEIVGASRAGGSNGCGCVPAKTERILWMRFKRLFAICVLFSLLATGLVASPASAQSCVPRSDWSTYRVTYGDTLYKIAVRFNTTTAELAAANCTGNINLIYLGQVLRVPPPGGATGTFAIPVTTQQFEKGFMIWRTDTGDVWVYVGATGGAATRYPSRSYGALPDNPVAGTPPAGLLRPIMGFGKVWGNFPNARASLGWATKPETSYIMYYSPVTATQFYFTLSDGRNAVTNGSTWGLYTGTLPPGMPSGPSTVTTSAAYQLFENGFLLWRADSGRIIIFTKDYVAEYSVTDYGPLPNNPITQTPPTARVSPINGFGKVWGNYAEARNALGWGLAPEQGYQATFKYNAATYATCVNLPNGQFVSFPHYTGNRSWMWQFETSCN
ncbi:MAG: LysM peptidoglycan-binding domain-containing protein [Anaerolineae bacterium]|nr:LysM peptidoglycan-binding domain-containing protein [Anaerolineae bacterium]